MEDLVLESSHELYYSNSNLISIPDIIKALNGLNGIIRQLPSVLEAIYGVKVEGSAVLISKIEAGSLLQKFWIALNFSNEDEMQKAINKFGKKHPVLKNILNALLAAVAIYFLLEAASRVGGDTSNIEANNNVIINIGAGEVGMTPDGLRAVLDSALKDKDAAARSSLNIIAPAKTDPKAALHFGSPDEETELVISAESISEAPDLLKEIIEVREAHIDNAIISVRAIDLDNRAKGWFGLLKDIKDRLPIALDPRVDAELIYGTIYADIILIYERRKASAPFMPVKIVIKRMGNKDKPVGLIPNFSSENTQRPTHKEQGPDDRQSQLF